MATSAEPRPSAAADEWPSACWRPSLAGSRRSGALGVIWGEPQSSRARCRRIPSGYVIGLNPCGKARSEGVRPGRRRAEKNSRAEV